MNRSSRARRQRPTMRKRLIVTYAFGIVFPLLILGTVFIQYAGDVVEDHLIALAETSVSQVTVRLDDMFSRYTSLTDQYLFDALFLHDLRKPYTRIMDAYELYSDIWSRYDNLQRAWPYLRGITIYTENPTLVTNTPFVVRMKDYLADMPELHAILDAKYRGAWSGIRNVFWRNEYWSPKNRTATSSSMYTFTYNRSLYAEGNPQDSRGVITVEIYEAAIKNALAVDIDAIRFAVVSERNDPVYPHNLRAFPEIAQFLATGEARARVSHEGGAHLLSKVQLDNGWWLLSEVSLEIVTDQAKRLRSIAELILLGIAALALTMIWGMSGRLTKDVRALVSKIGGVENHSSALEPAAGDSEEIRILDNAFSAMIERLHEAAETQYGAEVKRKEAQLELLHTQISPHFLYNMLSTIAWLADSKPRYEVRYAIESLARYYRLTLAKGREVITLREELGGLSAYIDLQRLRFGNRIRCMIDVDEAFLNTPIPRMTLQPLVENCIVHGPGDERRPISILLSVRLNADSLRLMLEDDGIGVDAERLAQLEAGLPINAGGSGLGYRNVADRIRIYFGDAYGVKAFSAPGQGMRVEIELPFQQESDGG